MKVLFKKRWHRIPIGIASIVLALMLVGGGVLAGYLLQNGNAEVTVDESITITNVGGDNGNFDGAGTWAVTLYPGQSKHLDVLVSNASPVDVLIGATAPVAADVTAAGISAVWSGAGWVSANSSITLTLTVTAAGDISPTTTPHLIYFEIFRG